MGHQGRDGTAGRRTRTARRLARLRATTALSGVAGIGRAETASGRGPTPVATALRALAFVGLLAAGVAATDRAARANGGQGGNSPGSGGMNNPTGPGSPGGAGFIDSAGGGGGSGTTGGNGGPGTGGAQGGSGGTSAGAPGLDGASLVGGRGGGGGGGGGAHGAYGSGLPAMAVQGGNGGNGGNGAGAGVGGGGGGGAGGYGAVVTGNAGGTLAVTAMGGNGGYAGTGFNGVAGGGSGGVGLYFTTGAAGANVMIGAGVTGGNGGNGNPTASTASGAGGTGGAGIVASGLTLTITAPVDGGNGGTAFYAGTGGAGISGSGLTIINTNIIGGGVGGPGGRAATAGPGGVGITGSNLTITNSGTISGGVSGATVPVQAYAIQLTGGTNSVGGPGTITGGIDVAAGSFQPSLPGSAVGTPLAVGGPIAFAPGSFYNVRITPTATDSTVATGAATLTGASVDVAAGNGVYTARRYTILTAAGGLGGTTFSGVTSNLAFLMPTLSYDADDVYLTISGGGSYVIPGLTQNQYSVASGLTNAARANGDAGPILTAFNQLTVPQAQAAFDAISGEGIAAAQNTAFGSTSLFISSIFDQTTFYGNDGGSANQITLTAPVPGFTALAPADGGFTRTPIHELADLPSTVAPIPAPVFVPQRSWRAWATGFGGVEDFSGNAFPVGSAGQTDSIYGGTLGIDYQLMPNYLAGLAVGGSNGDFSVPGRATSGSTTGGHVAFYDLATFGAFYAASTTSASFYSNQTTRTIAGFGGLAGETDRGNFRSDAYSSKVEFGRHFAAYGGLITPFASIELTELRSYGFTETPLAGPGLFALNVQGQDTASVPSLVGARFQTLLPLGNGLVLSPSLQVAWEHQFSPQRPVLAGLINLPGAVFLTNGASPARDSAAVKAGGELAISRQAALFANFDGDFSGIDRFYGGKGGFKYVW